jgi:MFS family permease
MFSTFSFNREKYLGFAESAAGIGLMVGPLIGGSLNSLIGYLPCYMIFAGLLAITGVVSVLLLP